MNKILLLLFLLPFNICIANKDVKNLALGKAFADSGHLESIYGEIPKSVSFFYKAIDFYEKVPNTEVQVSDIYYMLASIYLQTLDTNALSSVVCKMEQLTHTSKDPFVLFNLYSVKTVYFETLLNHGASRSFADSAIHAAERSIDIMEKHPTSLNSVTIVSWNYVNLAVLYEKYINPRPLAKINQVLEKALETRRTDIPEGVEVEISVYDLRAWLYYYEKDYTLAEATMQKVLNLLASLKDRENTIQTEWYEATKFMVMLYEETRQLDSALKYEKKLLELSEKRFNLERAELINEMEIKYEVQTKDLQIELLTQKTEIDKKHLWVIGLSFLIFAIVLIVFYLQIKRMEQRSYQAALESELGVAPSSLVTNVVVNMLKDYVQVSILPQEVKEKYIHGFDQLNIDELNAFLGNTSAKITTMDLKYICCFYIQMETRDIATLFHIEVSSVNTVRYRLRKKIGGKII